MAQHIQIGQNAERIAQRYLEKRGLRLIAANYRCRYGELDLVMKQHHTLVMIEIRYRRDSRFMLPEESIDPAKRKRITLAAMRFIQRHPRFQTWPVRFDVVCLSGPLDNSGINWIPGAFSADDPDH